MNVTYSNVKGISEKNRRMLQTIHRGTSGPFTAKEVADLLSTDVSRVQRFLAYLVDRGWLARVRRGLYITVPLDAVEPSQWHEDTWVIVAKLFDSFYIGGWSACEHWGLTDQLFRETVVVSAHKVRNHKLEIQGFPLTIKVVNRKKIFGTSIVWRGQARVYISDPSRTIVDIMDDPKIGGGIRHVNDVLNTYFNSEHRDDEKLIKYVSTFGNRAIFKRIGYLAENLGIYAPELIDACIKGKSSGIALLDPTAPNKGRILKRWNLRINVPSLL